MQIELREVHKWFGDLHVLRGVGLTIPRGRRVGLIGPNGSGKSTLTRVIMGILECDGEVRLDGEDPAARRAELLRRMAYVPQIAPQLATPVAEVLRTLCALRELPRSAVEESARGLDLSLTEISSRPFRNLSGGMKQKLLLSIALASGASLLVLDEPTASLDARSRERFMQLFLDIPKETTVILCSHRLEEIKSLVEYVVSMADGSIARTCPVAEHLAVHADEGKKEAEAVPHA